MFKKIFILLCVIMTGTLAYSTTLPQEVKDEMKEINDIVFQQVNQAKQEISLYNFVKENIEQYYGRTNFKDENQTTGWYRVDKFLKWVKKNEKDLQNASFIFGTKQENLHNYSIKDNLTAIAKTPNKEEIAAFWVYLGARYTKSIYDFNLDFSDFVVAPADIVDNTKSGQILYRPQTSKPNIGIIFNLNKNYTIPQLINIGIHETSHLIPHLIYNNFLVLPELAPFYSEYNFALPVKPNEVNNFGETTRNIRRLHDLRPDIKFINEYNEFIAGIILNKQLTPEQILKSKYSRTSVINDSIYIRNATIVQATMSFINAKNNSFMIGENPLTIPITDSNDFLEKVKLFNLTQQEIKDLFNNKAFVTDLGKRIWPGTDKKVNVIFKNTRFFTGFVGGLQRINENQLLQIQFGEFANKPKLKEFYNKLISHLPSKMLANYNHFFPILTLYEYRILLDISESDAIIWQNAILQALNEVTTDSMPIPERYL